MEARPHREAVMILVAAFFRIPDCSLCNDKAPSGADLGLGRNCCMVNPSSGEALTTLKPPRLIYLIWPYLEWNQQITCSSRLCPLWLRLRGSCQMFRLMMLTELQALWGTMQSIGAVGIVIEYLVLKYLITHVDTTWALMKPVTSLLRTRPTILKLEVEMPTWPGFW